MQGIIMIMKALVCMPRKESNPDLWDVVDFSSLLYITVTLAWNKKQRRFILR